ncbi:hypothetical protein GOP47_0026443 [Adiantum capillus-veneris]|nr:hypothetical protein GOP47_0026443 [Adiantum capillus-veneris]
MVVLDQRQIWIPRIYVNSRKSKLFLQEIQYLSHIISKEGIQMDPQKLEQGGDPSLGSSDKIVLMGMICKHPAVQLNRGGEEEAHSNEVELSKAKSEQGEGYIGGLSKDVPWDHALQKPVISPTRPPADALKQRQKKHSASKTSQVKQESLIALCTDLKQSEAVSVCKDVTHDDVCKDVAYNDVRKDATHNASPDSARENQEMSPLPNISEPSTILSESLRCSLCTYLPTLVRGREWVLLYSTWKHGISLRTLYRRSTHISGPYLLAVEDGKGVVFGGLLIGPLNPTAKPKFQGTHDSFVFTTTSADFGVFRATGANRYYQLCTNDMLGLGGGGSTFALRLHEDLMHGSSGLSETFGNRCLSHSEEFNIRHVELWGFAHTSKYVPRKALYRPQEDRLGICRF